MSVSTDIALAPFWEYRGITSSIFASLKIQSREGERRLNSAIIPVLEFLIASLKEAGVVIVDNLFSNSLIEVSFLCLSTSNRLFAIILSKILVISYFIVFLSSER